ncbi:transcriptional regulator [Xylocopilactobacillus apicola]|uniref:Transcriptional regulator n=1 Tax=Xylocopilactobacillus apicola TaxID=2932184 RepID=A0AAU9DDW6_9LACO|nr:transcriptional regulator [Xylocopilactobacillus apicola]
MEKPSRKYSEKRPRKGHYVLKVLLLIVVVLLGGTSLFASKTYLDTRHAINKTYHGKPNRKADKRIKERDNLSILILGIDTGEEGRIDRGNSDTMIVATLNPNKKKMQMVSIPRDTAAQIMGANEFKMTKINSAYNLGGSEMAKDSVASLLNIPVNYYLTLDMKGLEKVVDAVGGVDVDVPFTFTSEATGGQTFYEGKRHLDGNMALAYARMRHEDPEGDYGRQKRQQQVIKAILSKAMSFTGVQHLSDLLNSLSESMATDISFDNMVGLFNNYRSAADKISSDSLKGQTAWIQTPDYDFPLSFQVVSDEELQRISDLLRDELGLEKETISNAETKENALNPEFKFGVDYDQNYVIQDLN